MKKNRLFVIIATGFAIISIISCTKDDSSSAATTTATTATTSTTTIIPDVRDVAIGSYSGFATQIDADTTITDTATIFLSKGTGSSLLIDMEDVTIKTSDVISAGNNFACNIPTQSVMVGSNTFTLAGKGANNQQVTYSKVNGVSTFSYRFTVTGGTHDFELYFTGTK